MKRILIVDDNRATRRPLIVGLKGEGYRAEAAASAEEALGKLSEAAYDCVVSDVHMPGMSGVEFMEEGQRLCPNAKWILMSAYDFPYDALRARGLAPHGFLPKPFKIEDLIKEIEK